MNHKRSQTFAPGIGATKELSLRVSVATLVRVIFENPRDGDLILALERKATLLKTDGGYVVEVLTQPFGGAVRIRDLKTLRDGIGDFHFDSEESRSEQDFRIFIRPSDWETVQHFCLPHLDTPDDPLIESHPRRELVEEFADTLKISLPPNQYDLEPVAFIVENNPAPTGNIHARGYLTARIYRLFEARILDSSLARAMMANSNSISSQDLHQLALEDARDGGEGRANAILALRVQRLREVYLAMSPEARNGPVSFGNDLLDETVTAVLEGVTAPKYRRL